jgi:nucleotide-binding universal stress UspA family protein
MSADSQSPVLAGIDGSRDGLIALSWAVSYATLCRAPLRAVHIIDETRELPAAPPPSGPDDGTEVLADALEELERLGFHAASLEVRYGRPAMVLLDLAEQSRALVVGRRGMGGFAELVLGSTSQECTALITRVPLIVVPDSWDPAAPSKRRIVVGIDGSDDGEDALRFAFEVAAATNAEIHGVHAVEIRESYPDPEVWLDPELQPWSADSDELVQRTLAGWQAKYPQVVAQARCVADHPVRALARESESADLVVVGGLGRTAFSPLRLGSVARGLLHHSSSPVAVIHHS